MAIRSGFFNSVNGDRKYDAKKFAEYFASFIGNGVFPNPSNNLQVLSNDDMTVTVKAGKAWINGYILINDDDYILTLDPADGVLNRIDRIVARYDTVDREIRLEVKKGTFASSPVAPDIQRDADAYELALADIYVAAGAISISQANITDLRLNTELCGIVHGTVEQLDTTTLWNQYQVKFEESSQQFEADFNAWFDTIKGQLSTDVAGNLQNQINSHLSENASTTAKGHVQLYNGTDSDSTTLAATAAAVKAAMDKANSAFQSVNDVKTKTRTAIIDMGGTVADADGDGYPTGDELAAGVRSIPKFTFTPGETLILASDDIVGSPFSTSYEKRKEISVNCKGTIRVKFDMRYASDVAGKIYVNGNPVGQERKGDEWTTFAEDIAVNKGDLVQLYIRNLTSTRNSYNAARNFRIYIANTTFGTVNM